MYGKEGGEGRRRKGGGVDFRSIVFVAKRIVKGEKGGGGEGQKVVLLKI